MQLEAGEIRHPRERRRVARDDLLGAAPRRETQRTTSIQAGRAVGRALLKKNSPSMPFG